MDDLRRGKFTLPWKGFAEHCDYTEERFASILRAIPPHECLNEDIVSVLQEIVGYFAVHVLRDAEKVLELERTDRFARRIADKAEREAYREEARPTFDPQRTDAKDQLKKLVKTLRPALRAVRALKGPAAGELMYRRNPDQQLGTTVRDTFFEEIDTFFHFGQELIELIEGAELPRSKPGARQTHRYAARSSCIQALGVLWVESVGSSPTVNWNDHEQKDTGPFLRFCQAVFGPADPENNKGLASAIRRVLTAVK